MTSSFTLIPGLVKSFLAFEIVSLAIPRAKICFSASCAKIAVPSIAIPRVNTMPSPSNAPEDKIALFLSTSPIIVPENMIFEIPSVTSVCPPIRETPTSLQASLS